MLSLTTIEKQFDEEFGSMMQSFTGEDIGRVFSEKDTPSKVKAFYRSHIEAERRELKEAIESIPSVVLTEPIGAKTLKAGIKPDGTIIIRHKADDKRYVLKDEVLDLLTK